MLKNTLANMKRKVNNLRVQSSHFFHFSNTSIQFFLSKTTTFIKCELRNLKKISIAKLHAYMRFKLFVSLEY